MKRNSVKRFVMICMVLFAGIILAGCASTPAETGAKAPDVIPGQNESIIVIQRKKTMAGAAISMKVWIDEAETMSGIRNGQEVRLIVADGEHRIQAGSSAADKGDSVTFSVVGEEITFFAEPQMGLLAARFKLTETGKKEL